MNSEFNLKTWRKKSGTDDFFLCFQQKQDFVVFNLATDLFRVSQWFKVDSQN